MPKGKPPLSPAEIETVRDWIAQGAVDDTPANARIRYDLDHPPVYRRPPVIAALDFSPDGTLLAVGGFHEVLLWKADGSELVARLVGLSERIESVRFSPDGKQLAVTGGLPGRMGEVQVWDVAKRKLALSVPVTFDTVYGASWSPDGTKIAFGCADNTVRAIDAKTGRAGPVHGLAQRLGARHGLLGRRLAPDLGRPRHGGQADRGRHPAVRRQHHLDHARGPQGRPRRRSPGIRSATRSSSAAPTAMPKLYRVFRQTVRVIGDDSNLIREFAPMPGRINGVAVSADGKRIAAGSSLDGAGEVDVYGYEFDTELPDNIKAIMSKVVDEPEPAGSRGAARSTTRTA